MLKKLLLAGGALGFLLIMGQKDHVHVALNHHHGHEGGSQAGLINLPMGSIVKLEFRQGGRTWQAERRAEAWVSGEWALGHVEQKKITNYISMLLNSKPVRKFAPEELQANEPGIYGFGRDNLETSVIYRDAKYAGSKIDDSAKKTSGRISIRFGDASPDGSLRYVRREGETTLYVMSGFIYAQAEAVIKSLKN